MLHVVIVQIATSDIGAESRTALVAACSSALIETKCVLEEDFAPPKEAGVRAVSLVTLEEDHGFIEVGQSEDRTDWRTERVDFKAADPETERFRVLGFAIAALVDEVVPVDPPGDKPREEPSRKPAGPKNDEPRRAPEEPVESSFLLSLRAGFVLGRGFEEGTPRLGGRFEVALDHPKSPVGALVWGGFQGRPRDDAGFAAEFLEFGLGLAYDVPLTPELLLGARGGLHLENTRVSYVERTSEKSASAARLLPGAFLGVAASLRGNEFFGTRLVLEATRWTGGTGVEVSGGASSGSGPNVPAWSYSGSLFVEARFSL